MSDLSRDARAVLDAGRHLDDPRPSDRARVRRALFARVAAGGAATLLSSSAAAATLVKVVLPLAMVVAGGVGGTLWWRAHRTPDATAEVRVERSGATIAAPLAIGAEAPAPGPQVQPAAASAPAPANVPTRARAREPPSRNLRVETSMLAEANRALRDGQPRRSLRLLGEYDRRFPAGVLRQEMTATRIIARCQVAADAGAQEAARAFLAQFPASPLASRVQSSCARADR